MKDIIDLIDSLRRRNNPGQLDLDYHRKLNLLDKLVSYLSGNDAIGKVETIIPLDDIGSGYSAYRIMNDCESDNRDLWIECKYRNRLIKLEPGDIIIKMK